MRNAKWVANIRAHGVDSNSALPCPYRCRGCRFGLSVHKCFVRENAVRVGYVTFRKCIHVMPWITLCTWRNLASVFNFNECARTLYTIHSTASPPPSFPVRRERGQKKRHSVGTWGKCSCLNYRAFNVLQLTV